MRYFQFKLVEGYKEVTQKFAQEADPNQVADVINKYKDLVNRNQVQGNERNIDWWGKQGWQNFEKFVTAKSQQKSQTQQKKRTAQGKSYNLAETDEWLIVVPLDKDASCFHGKGTDWCTTKPEHDHFEEYFRDSNVTLIYFLQKKTGAKWASAVYADGNEQWFDINDKTISNGEFSKQTGIPIETAMKYVAIVSDKTSDVAKKANTARSGMKYDLELLADKIEDLRSSRSTERSAEIETLLLKTKNAGMIKKYMYVVSNGTPIEFEQNMQTLIALKYPSAIGNISNITTKTGKIIMQHNPEMLSSIDLNLAYNIVNNNKNLIPHPSKVDNYINLDDEIQKLFVEHNPLWIIAWEERKDLGPDLLSQKEKIIKEYFNKNPQIYAVVIEPLLTNLSYLQEITQAEYNESSRVYGAESFRILNRNLEITPPE